MDVSIDFIQIVRCALVSPGAVSIALSRLDKIGTGALTKGSNVEADLELCETTLHALKATCELEPVAIAAGSDLMTARTFPGQRRSPLPLAAPGFRPPASNAHN